jgi:hypothetical protein
LNLRWWPLVWRNTLVDTVERLEAEAAERELAGSREQWRTFEVEIARRLNAHRCEMIERRRLAGEVLSLVDDLGGQIDFAADSVKAVLASQGDLRAQLEDASANAQKEWEAARGALSRLRWSQKLAEENATDARAVRAERNSLRAALDAKNLEIDGLSRGAANLAKSWTRERRAHGARVRRLEALVRALEKRVPKRRRTKK